MMDRSRIREIHGIANARRCTMMRPDGDFEQEVTVEDRDGVVVLRMTTSSYPAALTPAQARILADHLNDAAQRVEEDAA